MAVFNKRELEALQEENSRLKSKLSVNEVRLSIQEKTIAEMRGKIGEMGTQVDEFRRLIDSHKADAIHSQARFDEVYKLYRDSCSEISRLESEISRLQTRPHNERGAGRKRRATLEEIKYILSLHADGHSPAKIAQFLTALSGERWNRSTIRNVILAAKN